MKRVALIAAALLAPMTAQAGNIAECEIVIMTYVEDESGGGLDVASFRPAGDFLQGVYDAGTELSTEHDGHPIRALMCERKDVMPDEDDYAILATGVPLAISQDFDSNTSDSLTLFFRDGAFRYKYVSVEDMDEAIKADLEDRLADFSGRDHGLGVTAEANDAETEDVLEENETKSDAEKELAEPAEDE